MSAHKAESARELHALTDFETIFTKHEHETDAQALARLREEMRDQPNQLGNGEL